MTRKLLLGTVLLLIGALAGTVVSEVRASTPPGVDAENWHAISDRLGILLGPESQSSQEQLSGTLMAKTRSGWLPLYLEPPPPMPRPAN
jgi:hypothetical protein